MSRRLMPVVETASGEPLPDAEPIKADAVDVLARTLWGEARGEPVRGIEALAAVVVNRVRLERRQCGGPGTGIVAVCRKPGAFTCWNDEDRKRLALLAVTETDPCYATCLRVARRAVAGVLPDPTNGATRYHDAGRLPPWAVGLVPTAEIGHRIFYDVVE